MSRKNYLLEVYGGGPEPENETPQPPKQLYDPNEPPALWSRLRRLEKLPHPLLHLDAEERKKSEAEWDREAPEIVDDLFFKLYRALGRDRVRALFEAALKEPPYYRHDAAIFNRLALDYYDCVEQIGELKGHKIAARVAAILKPRYPHKSEATIAKEVRDLVKERKRENRKKFEQSSALRF